MKKTQWVLPIFLFIVPLIITLAQISVLDFPREDPFFRGMPYSPYPQIFYFPIGEGMFLMILGLSTTFVLTSQWYRKFSTKIRIMIAAFLIVTNTILFWFGINLAQRAVIIEYLNAVNANGLHFLRIYMLPIMPEVFPTTGEFAFSVTIGIGIVGLAIMVAYYVVLLTQKSKTTSL